MYTHFERTEEIEYKSHGKNIYQGKKGLFEILASSSSTPLSHLGTRRDAVQSVHLLMTVVKPLPLIAVCRAAAWLLRVGVNSDALTRRLSKADRTSSRSRPRDGRASRSGCAGARTGSDAAASRGDITVRRELTDTGVGLDIRSDLIHSEEGNLALLVSWEGRQDALVRDGSGFGASELVSDAGAAEGRRAGRF